MYQAEGGAGAKALWQEGAKLLKEHPEASMAGAEPREA